MSFFRQFLYKVTMWMRGRNGLDQLAIVSLIASIAVQLLGSILGSNLLTLAGLVLYGWTLFRIFSKKSYKRENENRRFLTVWTELKTKVRQFFTRLRLMRQYKYFKCPQCKALLRLTRGQGEIDVCCPRCQNRFRMKA